MLIIATSMDVIDFLTSSAAFFCSSTNKFIPSIKFNWRGEPLLNSKLPEIIDYAKQKGILETMINTNATKLNEEMSEKIRGIRRNPIDTRIRNLFMEIDQLGNYTDSSWFSQLDRIEFIRCFRLLRDIWNYRSRLSFHIKIKISMAIVIQ